MGEHHQKASDAALRAFHEKVAALGAVTLPDAAAAVGVDEDSLRKWDKQLGNASVFSRGPRNARVCRLPELRAELEQWRCTWPEEEGGCERFALLSRSGRCKRHDAAVPRHGKSFSTEYANARRIGHPDLIARLEAGEIPGERVERRGRPVAWLLDEREADAVLDEHWRCRWHEGCDRYGVGPTRHCNDHAGAATQIANAAGKVRVTCSDP
jgi:hypothetical protein